MTDNEKIAKFMDFDFRKQTKSIDNEDKPLSIDGRYRKIEVVLDEEDLEYDTSWDWLMPVVEKIGEYTLVYPDQVKEVTQCKVIIAKHILYQKVIQFIDFYNSQKQ